MTETAFIVTEQTAPHKLVLLLPNANNANQFKVFSKSNLLFSSLSDASEEFLGQGLEGHLEKKI